MRALEARRYGTLALLAVLFLLAILGGVGVSPYTVLLLFLAVLIYVGYARKAERVLQEEAARRLGLAFSPEAKLPATPFFSEKEPEAYGEIRGEVLGHPFRRCEAQVYAARRFGTVAYRFTGVLYAVALPRAFPPLHLAPRGWPTYPRARWPFLLDLLLLSGFLLALLALFARYLAGIHVPKPGTILILLLSLPFLYPYIFAAWRAATRGIGPEVALEGELARRFRAWGRWEPIGEDTPLGQALLEARKVLGPFWLRVEGERLYLAFPEKFFPREEAGLRGELGALEGLLWALGELHPER